MISRVNWWVTILSLSFYKSITFDQYKTVTGIVIVFNVKTIKYNNEL